MNTDILTDITNWVNGVGDYLSSASAKIATTRNDVTGDIRTINANLDTQVQHTETANYFTKENMDVILMIVAVAIGILIVKDIN
jgi:hypothetical protein